MITQTELKGYEKTISEATGVTDPAMLAEIEDCMRHDIFHSTLDWQTKAQLNKAAREAHQMVLIMADPAALAIALSTKV